MQPGHRPLLESTPDLDTFLFYHLSSQRLFALIAYLIGSRVQNRAEDPPVVLPSKTNGQI